MKNIKRGNGEGSWTKLATNKWKVIITIGVDINGKQKRRSKTGTKQECLEWLKKNKATSCDDYFYDYAIKWIELIKDSIAESTISRKKTYMKKIASINNFKIKNVSDLTVQQIKQGLGGNSTKYKIAVLSSLRQVLEYAFHQGDINKMPIILKDKEETFDENNKFIPTKEQILVILSNAKYHRNKKIYPVLLLAFLTGMRIGEILALKKEDIDLKNNTIYIHKTWSVDAEGVSYISTRTKTKSSTRKIYVNHLILEEVYKHCKDNYLFYNANNKPYTPITMGVIIKRFMNRFGFGKMTAHTCRHTFITLAQEEKVDFLFISKYVGHVIGVTTFDVYTHIDISNQNKELDDFVMYFFK